MTRKLYTARAIKALGGAATIWLTIGVVGDLVGATGAAIDLHLLSRLPADVPVGGWGAFPDDSGLAVVSGLLRLPPIITFLVCAFVVLKWMYRANRNAQSFARGTESTPPGAVYWYFVPIGNLWKPYEAMEETWRISRDPANWRRTFAPGRLRWWWGFWLVSNVVGNISTRIGFSAPDVGRLSIATTLELASTAFNIAAAVTLIGVVRQITDRQTTLIDQNWRRPDQPGLQPWSDTGAGQPF